MTHEETREFWRSQDWTLCDSEIARRVGTAPGVVQRSRKKLGIARGSTGDLRANNSGKIKVTLRVEDFTATDAEMARIHGITRERVRQIRKSFGLPPSRKNQTVKP